MTTLDPGPRPELTWLPVDRLDVDDAYQRTIETRPGKRLIEKIVSEFRWARFQAILATPNGADRWKIIDGQHRVAAARQVGIVLVPAVVIQEASQAEQAAAFVGANRDRVPVSAQALFHARLLAGDEDAVTIKRLCEAAGITLYRYNIAARQFAPGHTAAVPALLASLKVYGEPHTAAAIAAVAECCGQVEGGLRGPFFLTAARYLSEGGGSEGLKLALSRLGVERMAEGAHGRGSGGKSGSVELLALLRQAINEAPRPAAPARPTPSPKPKASPLKWAAPAASPLPKPDDQAAIDRFLAEKGATKLPGVGDPALREIGELVWDKELRKWARPAKVSA